MEGFRPYPEELAKEYKKNRWWLETTFIEAFDRTCEIYPRKEAVVEGEERVTFSQLRERSQEAALAFLELGIRKGSFVLHQVPNWIESLIIYIGLQTIGALPIMCIPRHGQRELERFCEMTGAVAWFGPGRYGRMEYLPMVRAVQEKYPSMRHLIVVRDEAPAGTMSFFRLTARSRLKESSRGDLYRFRPSPDDVIHVAPTGGTTGLPKLVPRTHNSHLTKSYYWNRCMEKGPQDVDLLFAPINHDGPQLISVGFMVHLGGKLVLCPSIRAKDILEHIEKHRATSCFLIPALLRDIVYDPNLDKYDLSSLRAISTGGAHCPPDLVKTLHEKLSCDFYSCYGQTEGTGTGTSPYDSFEVKAHTVGKRFCPYDIYKVVDDAGHELPQGKEGELVARGPCIFAGYYKSEEDIQLQFTRDGFFRTGDLAKFDAEGNLIITGRKKDVINRGGEKVSAYEVEGLVAGHPKVKRAAVVGMPDPRLGERICAYVELHPGQTLDLEELLNFLKVQGASPMVLPERLEVIEALPLTVMEKVDKQRLRAEIAQKLRPETKI